MATPSETLKAYISSERLLFAGHGGIGPREASPLIAILSLAIGTAIIAALLVVEPFGIALRSLESGKSVIFVVALAGILPAVLIAPLWIRILNRFAAYGLTENHLIWVRSAPFTFRRKLPLSDIRDISRTDLSSGRGSLTLTAVPDYEPVTGAMKTEKYELIDIEGAATLEALIRKHQAHGPRRSPK